MKIGQLVNKIATPKLNEPSDKLIDSRTLLGVEVELENFVAAPEPDVEAGYWNWKVDNSLRNNGQEFVFAAPLSGLDAIKAISWLCATAKKKKYKISNLCGIHTHLDVRSMELTEFRTFGAVYACMEPLIYNWVGDDRHANMFCLPWFHADGDLGKISNLIKAPRLTTASEILNNLSKYSGLNLNSLPKFGTVEFRMLQTTFDFDRIVDWLNIILSLNKYALDPANSATRCCTEVRTLGAYASACRVFGTSLTNKMWYSGFTKEIISLGLVTADWFLDTSRDMYLKDKPKGSIFDWADMRKNRNDADEIGDNPGLLKWYAEKGTPPATFTTGRKGKSSTAELLAAAQAIPDWYTLNLGTVSNTTQAPPIAWLGPPEEEEEDI